MSKADGYDYGVERKLLGALMLDKRPWEETGGRLEQSHFMKPEHRVIFGALAAVAEAGLTRDAQAIAARIEANKDGWRTWEYERYVEAGGVKCLERLARTRSRGRVEQWVERFQAQLGALAREQEKGRNEEIRERTKDLIGYVRKGGYLGHPGELEKWVNRVRRWNDNAEERGNHELLKEAYGRAHLELHGFLASAIGVGHHVFGGLSDEEHAEGGRINTMCVARELFFERHLESVYGTARENVDKSELERLGGAFELYYQGVAEMVEFYGRFVQPGGEH